MDNPAGVAENVPPVVPVSVGLDDVLVGHNDDKEG
jgi:hypothetical protein